MNVYFDLLRPQYNHFRCAESLEELYTGRPQRSECFPYSRATGWYGLGEFKEMWNKFIQPSAKGGATTCQLINGDGIVLAAGLSLCSHEDNFCYETGRLIALGRAFQMLGQDIESIPNV